MQTPTRYATLTPGQVTVIDLTDLVPASPHAWTVRVSTDGESPERVYFRADGIDPEIDGDESRFLLGGQAGYRDVRLGRAHDRATKTTGPAQVRLVSQGAPWVAVELRGLASEDQEG